ncbi:hypothetical protein BC332_04210 [Capsicum chinense]|nr:hypothetical protein BC332_04210 [Capsicum chinense]
MNMIQDLPDVVDISDPSGKINNQQVAYDWKPLFCKICTRFGHICRREEPRHNKPQGRQNQVIEGSKGIAGISAPALTSIVSPWPLVFGMDLVNVRKSYSHEVNQHGIEGILTELWEPIELFVALFVVLAKVKRNDASGQPVTTTTGGYKLVVATSNPKRIASPNIANIQGWLPGLKVDGDSNQLPTISIVASYDTFGIAPTFSVGSNNNGSGVVALLEIARLFYALYSNPKTRGRYIYSLD